jgi:hypothetical protein
MRILLGFYVEWGPRCQSNILEIYLNRSSPGSVVPVFVLSKPTSILFFESHQFPISSIPVHTQYPEGRKSTIATGNRSDALSIYAVSIYVNISISSLVGQRHTRYEMFIFGNNRPCICFVFSMEFLEFHH